MEQIKIENLNFRYPLGSVDTLKNINFTVNSGEYIVICGRSGCGKTTLLRMMKTALAPKGEKNGRILFCGKSTDDIDLLEQSRTIGFVMQNPDNQIVTDTVWHEMSFGLENLGLDNDEISLRLAETASFFGVDEWFNRKVSELSGGQKQLLNLAAIMAMQPSVLILDEPTSQLDPIAAENFLSAVRKINTELGVTVIIAEHRLEEIFSCADRVIVMENGEILLNEPPREIGNHLQNSSDFLKLSVPTSVRLFSKTAKGESCPLNVREGRRWLSEITGGKKLEFKTENSNKSEEKIAVELKNVCFRYSRNGEDILNDLSVKVPFGSVFAVLGGNGAGKSTLLRVISGISRAYSGKVIIDGKKIEKYKTGELYKNLIAALPQNVQTLFTEKTVRSELQKISPDIDEVVELTGLYKYLDTHPYDLSGGEQQRLGLAEVLLTKPKILLLDEPTKAVDNEFKQSFAEILSVLKSQGCAVILVSHDIEFCAEYADFCSMLFDGKIVCCADSHSFFGSNRYYTTTANRISRGLADGAVTEREVIQCLKENGFCS